MSFATSWLQTAASCFSSTLRCVGSRCAAAVHILEIPLLSFICRRRLRHWDKAWHRSPCALTPSRTGPDCFYQSPMSKFDIVECNRLFYSDDLPLSRTTLAAGVELGFSTLWAVHAAVARAQDGRSGRGPPALSFLCQQDIDDVIFCISRRVHSHLLESARRRLRD